ncbi:sensor histidine kinase [uncultured Paenibacillus sp.]|uniref:cache domain-containing sensor histidine kinase n=1 Tax=uncultured Paenibacillus sp. TaxID=227322 RepID=UPI0028D7AD24|nr:sensor histidine kinase [uncultured Paenibacillus sp.]
MKKVFDGSLYARALWTLILLALLPLTVLGLFGYHTFSRMMLEMIAESNFRTLDQVAERTERFYTDIEDILVQTSIHPGIQEIVRNRPQEEWKAYQQARFIAEYTNLLIKNNPEISKITLINKSGIRFDSLGRFGQNKWIPVPEAYRELEARLTEGGEIAAVGPIYRDMAGAYMLPIGKPVVDLLNGKQLGIVIADLNLNAVNRELSQVRLLQSGTVALIGPNQKVIYDPSLRTGEFASDSGFRKVKAGSLFIERNDNGEDFLYLRLPLAHLGWTLYGKIPYEDIAGRIDRIRNLFLIFSLVIIIVIGLVAVSLRRIVVKPLRKLQQVMRRVQTGEFNFRVPSHRNDEIGQLAESFNHMVGQLDHLIQQVYEVKLNESQALLYQKQAELDALQAHTTPHFLYNTLNSISWFAHRKGVREIQLVVDSLSTMLRYSMGQSSKFVTLEEEFDYIRLFANIIDFRYEGGFRFKYDLPADLKQIRLPRLTIQPLVENAIKHGYDDFDGSGEIRISALREEDAVVITVRDTGFGMEPQHVDRLKAALLDGLADNDNGWSRENRQGVFEGGTGLLNVQRRIRLWFGASYGLTIHSREGLGTSVRVVIPFAQDTMA